LEKKAVFEGGIPEPLIFNDLVAAHPKGEPALDCSSGDIAVLQYTGGTTGTPKAAVLTHGNLVSNVIQINNWGTVPETGNSTVICIIPFFHVFGMTICLNLSVYRGFRMILIPRFDWSSVLSMMEMIKKYHPHSFPAVPSLWAALVSYPDAEREHLSSIAVASSGGAPLPIWVQDRYESLTGRKIIEAYGLSEASSTTHMNPFQGDRIPGTIGLPLPNTDAKIVDIESGDIDLPTGEIGELVVKGPQVMQGYWGNPAETNEAIRGGWLHTGDIARMDERGYFYIVDRKKDLIIADGYNVYPTDVEAVLVRHPKVKDVAIIGVPHAIRGESITAFVVPEEDKPPDKEELLSHCRQNLPAYKVPNAIQFRESLPKNPLGKILRKILREEISG
jgi:long-chain acyl-CoA synthetase